MKFSVEIMPRPEALDPQGRAVLSSLLGLGFKVGDVRVGKIVILDLGDGLDKNAALKSVKEMAAKILANPLIETFEVKDL